MPLALSLLLVLLFLLMNTFFVVAEFASVRIRKSQIDLALEAHKPGASHARLVSENVNAYLSACQLGITLASLALGWLGEPAISALIHPLLEPWRLPTELISALSVAIGFSLITTLHIVIGELIPKSLAILSTEKYALISAPGLVWFYRLSYPLMLLFNAITNLAMRITGHAQASEHEVYTGEEIKLLIDESTESGLINVEQNIYVDNIFDMGEKDAEGIMTPRVDIICFDVEERLSEARDLARLHKYTRYPVFRNNKDNIIGFVHIKDLYLAEEDLPLQDLALRPIPAISEGMPLANILHILQERQTKIALVVDEHGGTSGIVTMSDVMEQIVGRLDDEYLHDLPADIVELVPNRFSIEGTASVEDIYKLIGFVPQGLHEPETLGGLIFDIAGEIPHEGNIYALEHVLDEGGQDAEGSCTHVRVQFTIAKMERHRVAKVELALQCS